MGAVCCSAATPEGFSSLLQVQPELPSLRKLFSHLRVQQERSTSEGAAPHPDTKADCFRGVYPYWDQRQPHTAVCYITAVLTWRFLCHKICWRSSKRFPELCAQPSPPVPSAVWPQSLRTDSCPSLKIQPSHQTWQLSCFSGVCTSQKSPCPAAHPACSSCCS